MMLLEKFGSLKKRWISNCIKIAGKWGSESMVSDVSDSSGILGLEHRFVVASWVYLAFCTS